MSACIHWDRLPTSHGVGLCYGAQMAQHMEMCSLCLLTGCVLCQPSQRLQELPKHVRISELSMSKWTWRHNHVNRLSYVPRNPHQRHNDSKSLICFPDAHCTPILFSLIGIAGGHPRPFHEPCTMNHLDVRYDINHTVWRTHECPRMHYSSLSGGPGGSERRLALTHASGQDDSICIRPCMALTMRRHAAPSPRGDGHHVKESNIIYIKFYIN